MGRSCLRHRALHAWENGQLVDTRIKPYLAQVDAAARREGQRRRYKRNQIIGLMLIAAAILTWWLFHTNPGWIFPRGWWRL
jgi:hypothetical protein